MSSQESSIDHLDALHHLTDGRPYIFLIESFRQPRNGVYELIKRVANNLDLACIRADDAKASGFVLLDKIHRLIRGAVVLIADTACPDVNYQNSNVFYEIGYAAGLGKRPILLCPAKYERPANLQGIEWTEYDPQSLDKKLSAVLTREIRLRVDNSLPSLRDMLMAGKGQPNVVVTNPSIPPKDFRIPQEFPAPKTYGDRLGILRLVRAFGSMYGAGADVEIISARHKPDELLRHDANLFLIGSPKVNPPVDEMLIKLQAGSMTQWSFERALSKAQENSAVGTTGIQEHLGLRLRIENKKGRIFRGRMAQPEKDAAPLWVYDHGLIIRSRHPKYPHDRLVYIIAGAHSLGTGAASLALTTPEHIHAIREKLHSKAGYDVLAKKDRGIWIRVSGRVSKPHYHLDDRGVTVEEVGVYEPHV